MGDDRYSNFESWRKVNEIKNNCKIIVYQRNPIPIKKIDDNVFFYLKNEIMDYSSTEIMKKMELNKLSPSTRKYIAKNKLYLKKIVFLNLYDKRYDHSLSVASHAKRLTRKNKYLLISKKAYLSGLVHDLFKYHDNTFMVNYILNNSNYALPPKAAMHGYVAEIWLKNEYGLKDKKILNSIRKHTIPDTKMSKLDKIIYVSDKISNDRKDKDVFHLRKMAYYDLDLTFEKIFKNQVTKLINNNIEIDDLTKKSYEKYIGDFDKLLKSKK